MVVNPFWFGVLMTVIGLIVLLFIISFLVLKRNENEEVETDMLMDENEFKRMLNEAVRDALRQNIMYGGAVEDHDDEAN